MSILKKHKTTFSNDKNFNFSNLILIAHQYLIAFELMAVFAVSLIVSALRFEQDFYRALSSYPGAPKVFLYPLIWYYFLYRTRSWDRSIVHFSNELYVRVIRAGWQSLLTFAAVAYLIKYPISRVWVISNAIAITTSLLVIRYIVRWSFLRGFKEKSFLRYLYIGDDKNLKTTMEEFSSVYGFHPTTISLKPPYRTSGDKWIKNYEKVISQNQIYGVVIGVGEIQDASLLRKLVDTKRSQVVDFVLATRIGAIASRFEKLESPNLVNVHESSLVAGGAVLKRIFDILFSITILILFSPVFLIVALLIKVTSPGPVLYVDERVGKDGELFAFPKFRSMYKDADKIRLKVLGRPDEDMHNRYKNDPRITPFGRFIRRWSIDELPQFWCVLIGTMSVVGPRPILKEELIQVPDTYQLRFLAKPGLTGLWQVTGRKEVAWHDRMIRDIAYIDEWSFSKDLFLIWKTLGAIVNGQGAH